MDTSIFDKLPLVLGWINSVLGKYESESRAIATIHFPRLPLYFSNSLLNTTKMVVVDRVPVPPLSALGLGILADFEKRNYDGITYIDTFFINRLNSSNESLVFHELVHVIQWGHLGVEKFLTVYAMSLIQKGYDNSEFEVMAREHQARFDRDTMPYDVASEVRYQLNALGPSILDRALNGGL